MFGNSREHLGADFFLIVKGKYDIEPTWPGKSAVRTRLPLNFPADSKQGGKDTLCLGRRPMAHAAAKEMLIGSG